MSNLYRYLLPKAGGGWLRRYYQHKKLLVSMELQSSDAVPMAPISIFDFTRTIDMADASTITSTTVDGWTVSDDGVINGSSTSNAVLIRTSQCWSNHIQSTHQRIKTKTNSKSSSSSSSQQQQQQQNHDTSIENLQQRQIDSEHSQTSMSNGADNNNNNNNNNDINNDDDAVQQQQQQLLLSRPYIRWYGNLNTNIGLESKVQRSGFCAIRSPIFPFDGASLQGLYSYLEIQCRYIPVVLKSTTTTGTSTSTTTKTRTPTNLQQQQQSTKSTNTINQNNIHSSSNNNHNTSNNNNNHPNPSTTRIPNPDPPQSPQVQGPSRIFTLNLRVTSALNDDIYQGHLSLDHPVMDTNSSTISDDTDHNNNNDDLSLSQEQQQQSLLPPFRTFVIPFDELLLTARGREREFQRRLMGSVDIESIGFLLMDNIEGPFQFDIAQIRAVNRLEDGTVYESPSQITRVTTSPSPVSPSTATILHPSSSDDNTQNETQLPPTIK